MSAPADAVSLAIAAMRDPDPHRALSLAEGAIAASPGDPRGHSLRAHALLRLDRANEAMAAASAALALDPDAVPALIEAVAASRRLDQPRTALTFLGRLVQRAPGVPAFRLDLANGLLELGEPEQAVEVAVPLARLSPDDPRAWMVLARACFGAGRHRQALEATGRLLTLDRDRTDALVLAGESLLALHEAERAVAPLERALALDPRSRLAADALLRALKLSRAPLERTLAVAERLAEIVGGAFGQCLLAVEVLIALGAEHAAPVLDRAIALDPDCVMAGWLRMQLPRTRVHEDDDAEAAFLGHWRTGLATLESKPLADIDPETAQATIFGATSFHAHYLGLALTGELRRVGDLVESLARRATGVLPEATPRPDDGRLRIGVCSAFIRHHTVTKLFGAMVEALDPREFEVSLFDLGDQPDEITARWRGLASHCHDRPGGLRDWADAVLARDLDLLVYPEVGMHSATCGLAALRLAPVQAMLWGHPVTSGLSTMDWMLSAAAMEPTDGHGHYRERLHALPNLGTCYAPPTTKPVPPPELAARGEAVLGFMPQMVQKLSPAFDRALARIAAGAPMLRLMMTPHYQPEPVAAYRRRLATAFAACGVDLDARVLLCRRVSQAEWLAMAADADFGLDSFRWSGGNTSLEMFWYDTPIVTLPGALMRSRHTLAMLERMELPQLVAGDADDYVRIAVELATSADFRAEMRGLIRERKHRLYDDRAVVDAFIAFCREQAGRGRVRRLARDGRASA